MYEILNSTPNEIWKKTKATQVRQIQLQCTIPDINNNEVAVLMCLTFHSILDKRLSYR